MTKPVVEFLGCRISPYNIIIPRPIDHYSPTVKYYPSSKALPQSGSAAGVDNHIHELREALLYAYRASLKEQPCLAQSVEYSPLHSPQPH